MRELTVKITIPSELEGQIKEKITKALNEDFKYMRSFVLKSNELLEEAVIDFAKLF